MNCYRCKAPLQEGEGFWNEGGPGYGKCGACVRAILDEQPATCKPDLQVQPLSFREQAAIAAMQAMISCFRVNNLGVQLKDDFDSSYFNRETAMDHDQMNGTYDGCKEIAADAWVFADHLEAERIRRINGKDAT